MASFDDDSMKWCTIVEIWLLAVWPDLPLDLKSENLVNKTSLKAVVFRLCDIAFPLNSLKTQFKTNDSNNNQFFNPKIAKIFHE